MEEALVDEQQRHHAATDDLLELQRSVAFATPAIDDVAHGAYAIEHRIAGAFKIRLL